MRKKFSNTKRQRRNELYRGSTQEQRTAAALNHLAVLNGSKKYWSSGSGLIEVQFTKEEYESIPSSGAADESVAVLMHSPELISRFDKFSDELIAKELKAYGAWRDEELVTRKTNLERLIWIACLELQEEDFAEKN